MKQQQTIKNYVNENAQKIISYLIKLIEYQENKTIIYSCKKKES